METKTYPTEGTPITLADGSVRHLRFSLGAVKRIKAQFGKTWQEILAHPPEELLPPVLMEGLIERDGLTEESVENLLTGPMLEDAVLTFAKSFFGPRDQAVIDLIESKRSELMAKATATSMDKVLATVQ